MGAETENTAQSYTFKAERKKIQTQSTRCVAFHGFMYVIKRTSGGLITHRYTVYTVHILVPLPDLDPTALPLPDLQFRFGVFPILFHMPIKYPTKRLDVLAVKREREREREKKKEREREREFSYHFPVRFFVCLL